MKVSILKLMMIPSVTVTPLFKIEDQSVLHEGRVFLLIPKGFSDQMRSI